LAATVSRRGRRARARREGAAAVSQSVRARTHESRSWMLGVSIGGANFRQPQNR
jgi:hypothetical protein